jgi:hypothetical protein
MDWIELAQGRDRWRVLVNAVMNLWGPKNAGNFLTSCKPVSLSRTVLCGVSKYFQTYEDLASACLVCVCVCVARSGNVVFSYPVVCV